MQGNKFTVSGSGVHKWPYLSRGHHSTHLSDEMYSNGGRVLFHNYLLTIELGPVCLTGRNEESVLTFLSLRGQEPWASPLLSLCLSFLLCVVSLHIAFSQVVTFSVRSSGITRLKSHQHRPSNRPCFTQQPLSKSDVLCTVLIYCLSAILCHLLPTVGQLQRAECCLFVSLFHPR